MSVTLVNLTEKDFNDTRYMFRSDVIDNDAKILEVHNILNIMRYNNGATLVDDRGICYTYSSDSFNYLEVHV